MRAGGRAAVAWGYAGTRSHDAADRAMAAINSPTESLGRTVVLLIAGYGSNCSERVLIRPSSSANAGLRSNLRNTGLRADR